MTPRQAECLNFIRGYWNKHGFAPTYREIGDEMGISTRSGVHRLIARLSERGWVKYRPSCSRSVVPLD